MSRMNPFVVVKYVLSDLSSLIRHSGNTLTNPPGEKNTEMNKYYDPKKHVAHVSSFSSMKKEMPGKSDGYQ